MCHGENDKSVIIFYDDDGVGKAMEEELLCAQATGRPRNRNEWNGMVFKEANCRVESVEQSLSRSRRLPLVPGDCLFEFLGCVGIDAYRQHQVWARRARTLAMTSSASISVAWPRRNLLILRQSSASHCAVTFGSGGPSRLATRSRASSARSSSGRANALSRMVASGL